MDIKINDFKWFGDNVDIYSDPWFRFIRVIDLLEHNITINRESNWLDVGCQIGQFLKLMQFKYGILPYGIDDYDVTNVVEICKKHLQLEISAPQDVINDTWRYFTRRIDNVGFDIVEEFKFVSALEVIEHMVDTDAFWQECRTHLQENGFLVLSTPNINSLRNRLQVLFGVYPSGMEYRTVNHHVRLYNLKTLVSHAEEHGFSLVAAAGVNFLPRRLVKCNLMKTIDSWLADRMPSFCGGIIALFNVNSENTLCAVETK